MSALAFTGVVLVGALGLVCTVVLLTAWLLDWLRAELAARTRSCS